MTLDDIEEMPAAEVKQKLEKAEREMSFHEKKTKEVEQMPMAVVEVVMDMSAGNRCISLPPLELKIGKVRIVLLFGYFTAKVCPTARWSW